MGRKSAQRKNAAMMLDSDDDSMSSSSSVRSELVPVTEEVRVDKDAMLDQAVDALFEKRGTTREMALISLTEAFNTTIQHKFVENKCVTLLHPCLNSIKKGSVKEIVLASHLIGLLALTTGPGDQAEEIVKDSVTPISEALRSRPEASKISSLLECLAIITFVGGEYADTEKVMQIMWQVVHPKLGPNVAAAKPSPAMITAVVSSWSFLLSTMDGHLLNPNIWQESMSYLLTLLDKDDRSVRIAAGEALALIFEIGSLEKFVGDVKGSSDSSDENAHSRKLVHVQGLRSKLVNQVRDLSVEAAGKGSAKKDLNDQRNTFRDILEFLENGDIPEKSMKIGSGDLLYTTTWAQLIQLNYLKHFLGGGFLKHMQGDEFFHDVFCFKSKKSLSGAQLHTSGLSSFYFRKQENEFLHDALNFTPKKSLSGEHRRISRTEKRMFKSPNSALNKARTQFLNKQRGLTQDFNAGHYAVGDGDDAS